MNAQSGAAPHILQIVPFRSSRNDGIGDYARLFSEEIERQCHVPSVFLSATPAGALPPPDDKWVTSYLSQRSAQAFENAMAEVAEGKLLKAIILHIAPYAYQTHGLPLWLVRAIAKAKNERGVQIVGVFHELYVHGRAPSKAFWLGLLQQKITRRLLELVDIGITTNTYYLKKLQGWRPSLKDRLIALPVISTVGEPASVPPLALRPRWLVSFAGSGVATLSETHSQQLRRIIESQRIDEVHDVGLRNRSQPDSLFGVPVVSHGPLPASRVSDVLLKSCIGLLPYANMKVMGKSTILAAYAAHGVPPYALDPFNDATDGLKDGVNYLTAETLGSDLAQVQREICDWYEGHELHAQVRKITTLLHIERT